MIKSFFSLDFINFSIAQPKSQSVCNMDAFQVIGATNNVPVICGDNSGQHSTAFISIKLKTIVSNLTVIKFWQKCIYSFRPLILPQPFS